MSYKVNTIPLFDKQVKRLVKKYPSLKLELVEIIKSLSEKPEQGIALGNNFYKIRLALSSKEKGKSGGARIITYVKVIATTVNVSYVFDKSESANISSKELEQIFKIIP